MGSMKDLLGDELAKFYPERPGYKRAGTSSEAARVIESAASTLRELSFAVIAQSVHGMTADEVAKRLGKSVLAIRPRISELAASQRIRATDERRKNDSGMSATVYVASQ